MSTTTDRSAQAQSHGHGPVGPTADELAASLALGHETSDARARPLVWGGVGLIGLIIFGFIVAVVIMLLAGVSPTGSNNTLDDAEISELQLPPQPRLEQNPRIDGDRIIEEANARLESYGWVDRRAGTAHIPIERAIELLLERGVGPQAEPPQGGAQP